MKTSFRLTTFQKISFVWGPNYVTINDSLNNLFFVVSQKLLIAETRLNVLLGNTIKLLLIKTSSQQLMFI